MIAVHRLTLALAIGAVCVTALASCERKAQQEGTSAEDADGGHRETVLTGARIESRDYVAGRMADARCERESTCMDVGPGRRFANNEACTRALQADSLDHVTQVGCPKGTDPRGLQKCLEAVGREVCPRAIERLEHLAECRAESICYRP